MKDQLEDLSARARRTELSDSEAEQFEQLLAASVEARLWHRAGCEFDAEDTLLVSDHALSERIVQRVLAGPVSQQRRSRVRWVAWLVAAALLVVSVAAAALVGIRQRRHEAKPVPAVRNPPLPKPNLAQPGWPGVPAPPSALTPAPESAPPSTATAGIAAPASALGSAQSAPSGPAELFSAAGKARRQGYSTQAIALLNTLQARFPNSAEAHNGDITLGMLQLKDGAAGSALQHFDRYLQRSAQGTLAAEALWGRAQALSAQGNIPEARRSLTSLLQRYPTSSYASAARAKLGAAASEP